MNPRVSFEPTEPKSRLHLKDDEPKITVEEAPEVYHPLNSGVKDWVLDVFLLCIPIANLGYEQWLSHRNLKQMPERVTQISFIEQVVNDRNELKKYSAIAYGINALIFAGLTAVFPFVGAIALTIYACFCVKNLVQINNNSNLLISLHDETMILPTKNKQVKDKGKKEFSITEIE